MDTLIGKTSLSFELNFIRFISRKPDLYTMLHVAIFILVHLFFVSSSLSFSLSHCLWCQYILLWSILKWNSWEMRSKTESHSFWFLYVWSLHNRSIKPFVGSHNCTLMSLLILNNLSALACKVFIQCDASLPRIFRKHSMKNCKQTLFFYKGNILRKIPRR